MSDPFHIAILGDFSGEGASRGGGLADRRAIRIDRDNFDDVLAKCEVTVPGLQIDDQAAELIRFSELDDFDPDRLYARLPLFENLRRTRRRLLNDATFVEAAKEVRSWARSTPPAGGPTAIEPPLAESTSPESERNLLDQALQATRQPPSSPDLGGVNWHELIRDIVEPYTLPGRPPDQAELVACVDAAISASMRGVLHSRKFQQVESVWRSVHMLIRRVATDVGLKIFLLNIPQAELCHDLLAAEDVRQSQLYRLLVEQTVATPGGQAWSLLSGLYSWEAGADQLAALSRLTHVAAAARAPLISDAGSTLVDLLASPVDERSAEDNQLIETWRGIRSQPEAAALGLVWPRFLLRFPYGKKSRPVEDFDFEEFTGRPEHPQLLWGPGCVAAACMIGQAFSEHEWDFRASDIGELRDMPVCVFSEDGNSEILPCGEQLLIDRDIERLRQAGITPLISLKNQDVIRLPGLHHAGDPPGLLKFG